MNQKVLRLCILLSAAALAACTAKKPRPVLKPAGTTLQPVNTYRRAARRRRHDRPPGGQQRVLHRRRLRRTAAMVPPTLRQKPRILPQRLRKTAKPTRLAGRLHAGRANPTQQPRRPQLLRTILHPLAGQRKRPTRRHGNRLLRTRPPRRHASLRPRPLPRLRHPLRLRLGRPARQPARQQSHRPRPPNRTEHGPHRRRRHPHRQPRRLPHHRAH